MDSNNNLFFGSHCFYVPTLPLWPHLRLLQKALLQTTTSTQNKKGGKVTWPYQIWPAHGGSPKKKTLGHFEDVLIETRKLAPSLAPETRFLARVSPDIPKQAEI